MHLILSILFMFLPTDSARAQNAYAITELRGTFVRHGDGEPSQIMFEACIVEQISSSSVSGKPAVVSDSVTAQPVRPDPRGCFRWSEVHPFRAHELRYVKFNRWIEVKEPKSVWGRFSRRGETSQRFLVPVLVDVLRRRIADGRFKYVPPSEAEVIEKFEFGQPL